MESFIDRVAKIFNGRETVTIEGAIGEAKRLEEHFKEVLTTKVVNNANPTKTVEEKRKEAMEAINDFENMYRPEAGNVPGQTNQRNEGMEI